VCGSAVKTTEFGGPAAAAGVTGGRSSLAAPVGQMMSAAGALLMPTLFTPTARRNRCSRAGRLVDSSRRVGSDGGRVRPPCKTCPGVLASPCHRRQGCQASACFFCNTMLALGHYTAVVYPSPNRSIGCRPWPTLCDPSLPPRHFRRAPRGVAVPEVLPRTTRACPCPYLPLLTPPRHSLPSTALML